MRPRHRPRLQQWRHQLPAFYQRICRRRVMTKSSIILSHTLPLPMPPLSYYTTMAQYNQWMNERLYAQCAVLSDGERKRDRGAFFQSIHGTLNHLLYGDRAWMGRFTQAPFHAADGGRNLYTHFDELQQARVVMDRQIIDWSTTLTPEWLNQPFEYMSTVYQQTRILPTWLLVTHMFNHQTHHRGQLTTLLSQQGLDLGITDLPWMPGLSNE